MNQRQIETVSPGQRVVDDGDMLLLRALPADGQPSLGPFVFLDHYRHQGRASRSMTKRRAPPVAATEWNESQ